MASNVRVKICGITSKEDALKAVHFGAWALGFIFYKKSKRYVSPSRVKKIIEDLPPFITPVGVFVDTREGAVKDICEFTQIRTIQLHGEEDPRYCARFKGYKIIKAFRLKKGSALKDISSYKVDAYLFDTHDDDVQGGTGKSFDWEVLKDKKFDHPIILSGGLNASNVKEAIQIVQPFAVDVSSGVEKSPGVKDSHLLSTFFDVLGFPLSRE